MEQILNSFAVHSAEMLIFYAISWKTGNFGWVDFGWPLGFTMTASYYFTFGENEWNSVRIVISAAYFMCGLRFMLGWMSRHQNGKEDHRWALWRQHWSRGHRTLVPSQNINLNLLVFYLIQGWANALFLTVPVMAVNTLSNSGWTAWQTAGCLIYLAGFAVENVADYQLTIFKQKKLHKKVLDTGLWAYSRHPNYFGEWLIWLAYAVYALPLVPDQPMTAIRIFLCPLVAYWFLVHMTGIPVTEEASCQRRPAFREYQRRVSAFFPWLPGKSIAE